MTQNVDLKALADKLSTRQRKVVQTNLQNAKTKDKWERLGNAIWKSPTQTGFYV